MIATRLNFDLYDAGIELLKYTIEKNEDEMSFF